MARHEEEHVVTLSKMLCKIKHPALEPEQTAPGTCGDPIWEFYREDARMLLDLFSRFSRNGQ